MRVHYSSYIFRISVCRIQNVIRVMLELSKYELPAVKVLRLLMFSMRADIENYQ